MQMNQLKPVSQLAQRFGVKSLVFGGPGSGKTPISQTAPRPVLCVCEPGMLSMKNVTGLPAWEAFTSERIDEFFTWLFQSKEASNFDTVCIDSVSQMAEIILNQEIKRNKDGRKAYGEMARRMMDLINGLYFLPNKHIYLIAKQANVDDNGTLTKRPYFPGQDLNVKIPHLYDEILHLSEVQIQGVLKPVTAFRCKPTFGIMARDRSGFLNEFEEPNLTKLFNKCMQ